MINVQYEKGYIPALDGVRGAAILLVILFHCLEGSIYPISILSKIGWVGVDLFFVLSGFLITGILIDTKGKKNFILTFFFKRILRIFPLYYLSLLIFFTVILIPNVTSTNYYLNIGHFDNIFYFLTYTQNILFSFKGWGVTDILNHFWSLAIEEQFYLFWPLVVMFFSNKRIILISFLLIFTSLIIRNFYVDNPFSYVFTLSRMDALSIGSISAILIRKNIYLINKYIHYIFVISLSTLFFIILITHSLKITNIHFIRYGYTVFDILFASLIILTFDTKKIGKITCWIFNIKFLRFLGKYSYGIYVYHWLLYRGLYMSFESYYSLPKVFILPFLALVLLISMLSYHYYEMFFLKYKNRINENTNFKELLSFKNIKTGIKNALRNIQKKILNSKETINNIPFIRKAIDKEKLAKDRQVLNKSLAKANQDAKYWADISKKRAKDGNFFESTLNRLKQKEQQRIDRELVESNKIKSDANIEGLEAEEEANRDLNKLKEN